MSNSPTLACSRWCSSSRASGARLFSPAWPAARNWSRQCEARAAVIPNSRDTDSRSSPRSRRSTVARLRRAENRPLRSRSAAAPVALRRRRFLNLLPHLDTPPARTLSQSSVQENSRAQERTQAQRDRRPTSPAIGRGGLLDGSEQVTVEEPDDPSLEFRGPVVEERDVTEVGVAWPDPGAARPRRRVVKGCASAHATITRPCALAPSPYHRATAPRTAPQRARSAGVCLRSPGNNR